MDAELVQQSLASEDVHQVADRRALIAADIGDARLQQRLGDGEDALATKVSPAPRRSFSTSFEGALGHLARPAPGPAPARAAGAALDLERAAMINRAGRRQLVEIVQAARPNRPAPCRRRGRIGRIEADAPGRRRCRRSRRRSHATSRSLDQEPHAVDVRPRRVRPGLARVEVGVARRASTSRCASAPRRLRDAAVLGLPCLDAPRVSRKSGSARASASRRSRRPAR